MLKLFLKGLIVFALGLMSVACSSSQETPPYNELLNTKYAAVPDLTLFLHDMGFDESQGVPKHRYRIMFISGEDAQVDTTDWMTVSDAYFQKHINDLNMELANKKNGQIIHKVMPPGYSQYVGNSQYGSWQNNNGTSFWAFYGQYAFMSSMLSLAMSPRQSWWNEANMSSRPYYQGGRYGSANKNYKSSWNQSSPSFQQRVRNRVAQSTRSSRITRSSRSSYGSSSFRSRSGGFGK